MSAYPLMSIDFFPEDPLIFDVGVGGQSTIDLCVDWTATYLAFPPYFNENAPQYVGETTTDPPSGSSPAPLQTVSNLNSTQQLPGLALPASFPRKFDSEPVPGPSSSLLTAFENRPAAGSHEPLTSQGTASLGAHVTIPKVRVAGPSHRAPPLALPSTQTSEEGEKTHVWSAPFMHEGKRKRECTLCNVKVHNDSGSCARHERTSMHQNQLPAEQRVLQLECNLCGKVYVYSHL
ncbi:hypothetical protein DAEQUDRAFT_765117 [Daedalea quercina L-15889]|uniref:Uncharacterized protein n=1 Tax=Daedalea quercina L-15889 TaxID=1314783 RepID=A0A165QQJ3_9APHY|nr:hypothetical protein DAEQUDRAFT_765117 [Daedalea quercina L-15889]